MVTVGDLDEIQQSIQKHNVRMVMIKKNLWKIYGVYQYWFIHASTRYKKIISSCNFNKQPCLNSIDWRLHWNDFFYFIKHFFGKLKKSILSEVKKKQEKLTELVESIGEQKDQSENTYTVSADLEKNKPVKAETVYDRRKWFSCIFFFFFYS